MPRAIIDLRLAGNAMLSSPPPLPTIALCALTMALGGVVLATPTLGDLAAYFPPKSFEKGVKCPGETIEAPVMDDFRAEWYVRIWRAAEEQSLYRQASDAQPNPHRTYRFTLVPTFHAPIVVRLDERDDGRFQMTAKRLSGQGGYDPGRVIDTIDRSLTPEETRTVLRVLDETQVMTVEPGLCTLGADGTQWIFEGVEGARLHYADRWSPESGPIHDVGAAFLDLTGWRRNR